MILDSKEYILKNGYKIMVKSPEVDDAYKLLDNIITVAESTDYLLSVPKDYERFVDDIEKEKTLIRKYREGKDYLLAVYLNDTIIGNSSLNFLNHVKDSHRAKVGIAIQKEYWGLGIGTILFNEMIDISKNTTGIDQVELGVISENERAISLYKKMGFVKVATIPRHLKLSDGKYLDEDIMVLFLK